VWQNPMLSSELKGCLVPRLVPTVTMKWSVFATSDGKGRYRQQNVPDNPISQALVKDSQGKMYAARTEGGGEGGKGGAERTRVSFPP
jgi:hypothetical protein